VSDEATWLRQRLEELERIDRPSASDGERRAAEWLVAQLGELGAEARIEAEPAHGTYWWPATSRQTSTTPPSNKAIDLSQEPIRHLQQSWL
jgi:hypothetical protein